MDKSYRNMLISASIAMLLIGVAIGYGMSVLLLPTPSGTPAEARIGFTYGLTGVEAQPGAQSREAYSLAIEEINNAGGIKSLGGIQIVPIWGDHQGKPEIAMADAERLITEQKVVTIFGARRSSCALPVAEVCERYKIPFIIGESSSPALTSSGFNWTFRAGPHDQIYTVMGFKFMKDVQVKKGVQIKTIAYVYEDSLFGGGTHEAWKTYNADPQLGGYRVVEDISYSAATSDVTSEVLRLKAANPDIVLMASYEADAILFTKAMKALDFNCKGIITFDGHSEPAYLEAVGALNNYVFARIEWSADETKPASLAVMATFNKAYGKNPVDFQPRQYDSLYIWYRAVERAASLDPAKIRQALLATNESGSLFACPWERVVFAEYDSLGKHYRNQNPYALPLIVQFLDGKYRTVYPWDFAFANVTFPVPTWDERT